MSDNVLYFKETAIPQGTRESVPYSFDCSLWGDDPTDISVKLLDLTTGVDVTSDKAAGTPVAVGNVITLPNVHDLVYGHHYLLFILFTCGTKVFDPRFEIVCDR